MSDSQLDVEAIFNAARQIGRPDERAAYLQEACGDDGAGRARVEALLEADQEAESFLWIEGEVEPDPVGSFIGRYKLLQRIGQGGFGVVYMAEQKEPVKRKVALKVIKLGMDTKQVIARFEAERQALAMMDHPHIARVLDAGATEAGRPYFVMELVKGVRITEYCDTENLTTKERLELFIKVCQAVQHAHQKGIIHRDLKPSNVMVTLHDGNPVPKVIDFGIAKATDRELTDKTLFTEYRQFIGTPEYMSPEQAELSGLDIDTRSDIYSLGVLLYELLTGTPPFDQKRLRRAAIQEVQRIIREEEPHRPSTRLSEISRANRESEDTDSSPSSIEYIVKHRRTDPGTLSRQLRGDLDLIVMKALEKERGRRYETANGFARDIERFLRDEPVTATPPSASYRLQKLIKRNKGVFTAAAVLFCVLTLGVIGTTWGLISARLANDQLETANENLDVALADAKDQRDLAEQNEKTAVVEAARAERELERAKEIKRLITEMLASVKPDEAQGADVTLVKGILDDAASRLAAGEVKDELIKAELHHVVGEVYGALGLHAEMERHVPVAVAIRQRRLGPEHVDTLSSRHNLASLYQRKGKYAEAEKLFLETLETRKRVLGEEHPETLVSMNSLGSLYEAQRRYPEAETILRLALELRKRVLGESDRKTLISMGNVALLCALQTRYPEAESLQLKTVEIQKRVLGREHPDTLHSMGQLANLFADQGRHAEAGALRREVLDISRRVMGEEHPKTLDDMHNLASTYSEEGRYTEAESLYRQTLALRRKKQGPEHPRTLLTMRALANVHRQKRSFAEAERLFREALGLSERVWGTDHMVTAAARGDLAFMYYDQERYAEALPLFREALEVQRRVLGDEHMKTLGTITNLGQLYTAANLFTESMRMYEESLPAMRRVLGPNHPWTGIAICGLAQAYGRRGRHEEAEKLFLEGIELLTRVRGKDHLETLSAQAALARMYGMQQRMDESEGLLREVYEIARKKLGEDAKLTLVTLSGLSSMCAMRGRYEEAGRLGARALEGLKRVLGETHYTTLGCLLDLATVTMREGRHAEAEALLVEAVDGCKRALGDDAPLTLAAMTNLGNIYATSRRHEEAAALCEASLPRMRRVVGPRHPWTGATLNGLIVSCVELGRLDDARPLCVELKKHLELRLAAAQPAAQPHGELAWLLSLDDTGIRDPVRALELAKRACAIEEANEGPDLWNFLQVLARAQHLTGDAATAIETQKRAIRLIPKGIHEAKVADAKRALRLLEAARGFETKVKGILAGENEMADVDEAFLLAKLAKEKQRLGTAAFVCQRGLETADILGGLDDRQRREVYRAVCIALRAAAGEGVDAGRFDDNQRTAWRGAAVAWLAQCVEALAEAFGHGEVTKTRVVSQLEWWTRDPRLASIRGEAVVKLPRSERLQCAQLWSAVADLLERARIKTEK